jgi:hypothetical protein
MKRRFKQSRSTIQLTLTKQQLPLTGKTIQHIKKDVGHLYPGLSYLEDKVIE